MKICFISHDSGLQGAEMALLELAVNLRQHKGHDVHIILPSRQGGLKERLDQAGINSTVIPYKWWMGSDKQVPARAFARTLYNGVASARLAWMLRKQHFDIIYSNSITVNVGALAAFFLSIPHVWHIHEFAMFAKEDFFLKFDLNENFSYRIMGRLSDAFVVVSEALWKKYKDVLPKEKLYRIYQSISVRTNNGNAKIDIPAGERPNCAVVGKIQRGKHQEDAVLAVAALARRGIFIKLWLIGNGDSCYIQYLKQLIVEHDIAKQVKFTGFVDNPFNTIKQMDFCIICSSEAFGRVAVEAMLCGKPVIGAKAGATEELIHEGFNGLLYEFENAEDLADKIMLLVNEPELSQQIGNNAEVWAHENFSVSRYIDEIDDLLRSVQQAFNNRSRSNYQ